MRLLVTRPQPQADVTARRLAALGHTPIVAPLVEIVAEETALPLAGVGAVAVTSAAAIRALGTASVDLDALRRLPLFAVGARTAEAARQAGFTDVRTAGGDAAALAGLLAAALPAGSTVLHAAGRDRAVELGPLVAPHDIAVRVAVVYRAEAGSALPPQAVAALADGAVDGILVYSARSAAAVVEAITTAGLDGKLATLRFLALSPAVAAALARGGAADVAVAARPEEAALFDLLAPPRG